MLHLHICIFQDSYSHIKRYAIVLCDLIYSVDNPTDDDKKDELDSVVLKLGRNMKELVLAIVGIVDEATGDDQKH